MQFPYRCFINTIKRLNACKLQIASAHNEVQAQSHVIDNRLHLLSRRRRPWLTINNRGRRKILWAKCWHIRKSSSCDASCSALFRARCLSYNWLVYISGTYQNLSASSIYVTRVWIACRCMHIINLKICKQYSIKSVTKKQFDENNYFT